MLLYKDDLSDPERLRHSEQSERVVRYWNAPQDVYDPEFDAAVGCDAYFRLTAERMVYRTKILCLHLGSAYAGNERLMATSFVEGRAPVLSELLNSDICVGMAYVPLTPQGSTGRPILARLYCVSGLSVRYFPDHLLQDGLLPGMGAYSWFMTGLPDEDFDMAIDGRSWLLAAWLLMSALQDGNSKVIQNLTQRIVTGDVVESLIGAVTIKRKVELAAKFKSLKWIVPFANKEEVTMINVDVPETLEEAKKLIETNQNKATEALLRAVSGNSFDPKIIANQLFMGADINACDALYHENAVKIMRRKAVERILRAKSGDESAEAVESILSEYIDSARVLSYYADIPQLFFTLARRKDEEGIKSMLTKFGADAINATDICGETALDFALKYDLAAASVLRKYNARVGIYQVGSEQMRTMLTIAAKGFTEEVESYFMAAIGSGCLDLNAFVDFGEDGITSNLRIYEEDVMDRGCWLTADVTCKRKKTNVFLEAVLNDVEGLVVKKCIEAGVDVNMRIEFDRDKAVDYDVEFNIPCGFRSAQVKMSTPFELTCISKNRNMGEILKKAGAKTLKQLRSGK